MWALVVREGKIGGGGKVAGVSADLLDLQRLQMEEDRHRDDGENDEEPDDEDIVRIRSHRGDNLAASSAASYGGSGGVMQAAGTSELDGEAEPLHLLSLPEAIAPTYFLPWTRVAHEKYEDWERREREQREADGTSDPRPTAATGGDSSATTRPASNKKKVKNAPLDHASPGGRKKDKDPPAPIETEEPGPVENPAVEKPAPNPWTLFWTQHAGVWPSFACSLVQDQKTGLKVYYSEDFAGVLGDIAQRPPGIEKLNASVCVIREMILPFGEFYREKMLVGVGSSSTTGPSTTGDKTTAKATLLLPDDSVEPPKKSLLHQLRSSKWLLTCTGDLVSPTDPVWAAPNLPLEHFRAKMDFYRPSVGSLRSSRITEQCPKGTQLVLAWTVGGGGSPRHSAAERGVSPPGGRSSSSDSLGTMARISGIGGSIGSIPFMERDSSSSSRNATGAPPSGTPGCANLALAQIEPCELGFAVPICVPKHAYNSQTELWRVNAPKFPENRDLEMPYLIHPAFAGDLLRTMSPNGELGVRTAADAKTLLMLLRGLAERSNFVDRACVGELAPEELPSVRGEQSGTQTVSV